MADINNEGIIALYIRVSTEAQAEEGYSIEAQEKILRAECTAKEYPPERIQTYIDAGASGSNINRPAIQRLISDAGAKKISAVIVYKLDRLSRSQKDTLFLIEDIFIPNGIAFVSVNERLDTGSPYGKAMIGILSAFAQLERENIFLRTRMGMKERVRSGLWPGGGRVPFGYDYDSKRGILVPNADAETVRSVYNMYIAGYSFARIARVLGLKYERHAQQILLRKSNTGCIVYNGEEYSGLHEAIIDIETYNKAISEFKRRSDSARHGAGRHLLSGILICGECGARLRYQRWNKYGDYKLNCYSHDKSKPHLVKDPDCPFRAVWAAEIEDIILRDLWSLPYKIPEDADESDSPDLLKELRDNESRISRKIKRLYELYAEAENDLLLSTIEENNKALSSIQAEIEHESESGALSAKRREMEAEIVSSRELWQYMTLEERRIFLRSVINSIVIYSRRDEDIGGGNLDNESSRKKSCRVVINYVSGSSFDISHSSAQRMSKI